MRIWAKSRLAYESIILMYKGYRDKQKPITFLTGMPGKAGE